MPVWITSYCPKDPPWTPDGVLDAVRALDLWTLAEDFDVDTDDVSRALLHLSLVEAGERWELRYQDAALPFVQLHRWTEAERVAEEIREAIEAPGGGRVAEQLRRTTAITALEFGASQLRTMGVVLAGEIAMWLAEQGDGLVRDTDDSWYGPWAEKLA